MALEKAVQETLFNSLKVFLTLKSDWNLKHVGVWVKGQPHSYTFEPEGVEGRLQLATVSDQEQKAFLQPPALASLLHPKESVARKLSLPEFNKPNWTFKALVPGVEICSGSLCCAATSLSGTYEGLYSIGVLDGYDSNDGESWRTQSCVILSCDAPGASCLSFSPRTSGALLGIHLELIGLPTGTMVVPEVVASSPSEQESLLAPVLAGSVESGFVFSDATSGAASLTVNSTESLTSVSLYGRAFSGDKLPYTC